MLKAEGHGKPYLLMKIPALTGASIATALRKETPIRPFAHDLIVQALEQTGAKIVGVDVTDMQDGVFIAVLKVENAGKAYELDARPSDAIAVAARVNVPLRIRAHVLDVSGFAIEDLHFEPQRQPDLPEGVVEGSRRDM